MQGWRSCNSLGSRNGSSGVEGVRNTGLTGLGFRQQFRRYKGYWIWGFDSSFTGIPFRLRSVGSRVRVLVAFLGGMKDTGFGA